MTTAACRIVIGALAALALVPSLASAEETYDAYEWATPIGREAGVVVARQVSLEQFSTDCGEGCHAMDQGFTAVYEVLAVIEGDVPKGRIEFTAYSHGILDFAYTRHAVLELLERDTGGYVLAKYQAFPVDPTADGRWAVCLPPPEDPDDYRAPVPIVFADDVVFEDVSRWTAKRIQRKYPSPTYEVSGDRVRCTQGLYAEDYLADLRRSRAEAPQFELTPEFVEDEEP